MEHVRVGLYKLTKGTFKEAADVAEKGLLPILHDHKGFIRYGVAESTDGEVISISVWETHGEAEEAQGTIAKWVEENLADRVKLDVSYVADFAFWSGP